MLIVATVMLSTNFAQATLIQITGTSASAGWLGEFVLDTSLVTHPYTALYASDFETFYFRDPYGATIFNPTTVTHDTGVTYFSGVGSNITVVGGGGDSLTLDSGLGHVWIAGSSYVIDGALWSRGFSDVSWSTTPYESAPVPEPSTLLLLGAGLVGLGFARKRFAKK